MFNSIVRYFISSDRVGLIIEVIQSEEYLATEKTNNRQ
jgi:hypothetical protein